jgi:hypothetical protein
MLGWRISLNLKIGRSWLNLLESLNRFDLGKESAGLCEVHG